MWECYFDSNDLHPRNNIELAGCLLVSVLY